MAIKIAVVDDTTEDRKILKTMLTRYFKTAGSAAELAVTEFSSGEDFLSSYQSGQYALIFFDIYMGGMTGMDAARQVYRVDKDCRLIFFTTSRDFAVDSYQVRAAYYLMKPLDYRLLQTALDSIFRTVPEDQAVLSVTLKGGVEVDVLLREILYMDCVRRTVTIHKQNQNLSVTEKLSDVSAKLEQEPRFLCCNRGLYVNMDFIREMREQTLVLKNDEELPVRIHGRGQVKKDYLKYTLRELREDR